MNKLKLALLFFALGGVCTFATRYAKAESMGVGSFFDGRIQTAIYTPDDIFRVQAIVGRTSLVQLQPNETVMGDDGLITSGDPDAWEMGVNKAGNTISLKPKTEADPNTNLTIVTDRRVYLLELRLVKTQEAQTRLLRWTYPSPLASKKSVADFDLNPNPCSGPRNDAYQRRGDRSVSPSEVWDNGTFTCFRFPTNMPRPVIYQVLPDGTETLANGRPDRDMNVIYGVSQLFRVRLNAQVLEIRTRPHQGSFYNYTGTTTGEFRVVKHAEQ